MSAPALRALLFRALRAGFRLTPMPVATRDRLRQRFLARHADLVPTGPTGKAAAPSPHRSLDHAGHRLLGHVGLTRAALPSPLPATIVAFYLPQFHPTPENDAWWGKGFTEWRNVTRALPQFEGHAQPRLPGDLGYYDLRVPGTMRDQVDIAKAYGVSAFATYFYWFAGKTLLEEPLRHWLDDRSIDFPLALCWANENWSRRWDGRANDVLIGQAHSPDDDLAFIEYVAPYLRDPRYLRVDGKPVLMVYRPGLLPDARATAARWRTWCRDHGIGDLHLVYVQSFDNVDPASIGFDAAAGFPPNNTSLSPITAAHRLINPAYAGEILDWRALARQAMSADAPGYTLYPGINPGWDNEARRSGRGRTYVHATPRAFEVWARHAIGQAQKRSPKAPLVFVNAWNEWAEGAVLEPDARYGYAWLEAIRRAFGAPRTLSARPCAVIHVWYPELLEELVVALRATGKDFRVVLTVPSEKEAAVRAEVARLSLKADLFVTPNRGRDILPFLRVARQLLDEGEDLVVKLHTKRSVHRDDGAAWRAELVGRLIAPERTAAALEAFASRPELGTVAPEGHVQPLGFYWGANEANVDYLCSLMGIAQPDVRTDTFIAGSMFWCRLAALVPLLDAPLAEADFSPEAGQVDGTMAHAVERVVTLAAAHGGFLNVTAASLVGQPDAPPAPYAYAQRG
ncbi:glycoside hydrolase family 99-like domain-containing protein [Luteibacter aegosomatissinici]|uniref:glycoside hydrolase family 99-like domain-containing protein n=1 Tax=Luteibacter aegosomatissinici TaxID=2911539 RepID=UPI001FF91859|nr:glycoside hydrolase family 99-like domain-containing protein [Luteibacter aegosomatissinici]UPG95364.1 glycoside hydrolase family 99-like domain-containing protein [Luteibacter aegosomatissinici]